MADGNVQAPDRMTLLTDTLDRTHSRRAHGTLELASSFLKRLITVLLALSGLASAWGLPSFDPFADARGNGGTAYANGAPLYHQTNALGESWARWDGGSATYQVTCTNSGLSYSRFPAAFPSPSPTNAVRLPGQVDYAGGLSGQSAALTFSRAVADDATQTVTNVLYASFLIQVPNLGNLNSASPIYFAGFATNAGDQNVTLPASAMKLFLKGNSPNAGQSSLWSLGVADNSGSASAVWDDGGHTSNDVLFVVVAYEFGIRGNPHVARLWVNPDPSTFSAASPPIPTGKTSITAVANQLARAADFFVLARTGSTLWGRLWLSTLRVGPSWSFVTSPVLRFTHVQAQGSGLLLNGLGGASNGPFTLLASTNLNRPVANWTPAATNFFDAQGSFSLTNPLNPAPGRQFFAVRVSPSPVTASNDLWVPPCGALPGVVTTNSPQSIWEPDIGYLESHIGQIDEVVRCYHTPGSWWALTSTEKDLIVNKKRKVFISFKPDNNWGNAGGGNSTVNANLTNLAQSVAGIKPARFMLCVWHEPENDVNSTTHTLAQYRAMWQNVRHIFDAKGATNVIWNLCYMSYMNVNTTTFPWSTMTNDWVNLWPGNYYVDWLTWDAYKRYSTDDFFGHLSVQYHWFIDNSDATHNYVSKPWGLSEWGPSGSWTSTITTDQWIAFIIDVSTHLNAYEFPRLRFISYYDSLDEAFSLPVFPAYSNFVHSPYMTQQCGP